MRCVAVVALGAMVLASCQEIPGPVDLDPAEVIRDGAHGGRRGFFFMPPLVDPPDRAGAFDPSFLPVLRADVCRWEDDTCTSVLAEFTSTTAPANGEPIQIIGRSPNQKYLAEWRPTADELATDVTYRLRVFTGELLLGFADVDVVASSRALRSVNTGEYIPRVQGRGWPIIFVVVDGFQVPVIGPPANIQVVTGDGDSSMVGTHLPSTPTVLVTDAGGNPVPGVVVTFTASGDGTPDSATATTVATGTAATGWRLGSTAGANTLTAAAGALQVTLTAKGTTPVVLPSIPLGNVVSPHSIALNRQTGWLFVTNEGSDNVVVVDAASGSLVGMPFGVGPGPRGIAVDETSNRVFVANSSANTVGVYSGASGQLLGSWAVGQLPSGVVFNPVTRRLYVTNRTDWTVSVLDADAVGTVLATIATSGFPGTVEVDSVRNRVYVTGTISQEMTVIDGATNTVLATVPLASFLFDPAPVAVNQSTGEIAVGNADTPGRIDLVDPVVLGVDSTLQSSIGDRPEALRFDTSRNLLIARTAVEIDFIYGVTRQTVHAIPVPISTVVIQASAERGIAVDEVHGLIYIISPIASELWVIDRGS